MKETFLDRAFVTAVRRRFSACHERINHCLAQLEGGQVWWRPNESMNSIGNLILHLCGNIRQWVVDGIGGGPDSRNRPQEFAERALIPKAELIRRFDIVLDEAFAVLADFSEDKLLQSRRIQGFDETVLSAILDCLTHLSGHTQEIVYITRLQLKDAYLFAWSPATTEQGAPQ